MPSVDKPELDLQTSYVVLHNEGLVNWFRGSELERQAQLAAVEQMTTTAAGEGVLLEQEQSERRRGAEHRWLRDGGRRPQSELPALMRRTRPRRGGMTATSRHHGAHVMGGGGPTGLSLMHTRVVRAVEPHLLSAHLDVLAERGVRIGGLGGDREQEPGTCQCEDCHDLVGCAHELPFQEWAADRVPLPFEHRTPGGPRATARAILRQTSIISPTNLHRTRHRVGVRSGCWPLAFRGSPSFLVDGLDILTICAAGLAWVAALWVPLLVTAVGWTLTRVVRTASGTQRTGVALRAALGTAGVVAIALTALGFVVEARADWAILALMALFTVTVIAAVLELAVRPGSLAAVNETATS